MKLYCLINCKSKVHMLFFCSTAVLLLWIVFLSCLSLLYCLACVRQPCGHLLGKDRLLGSPVRVFFLCISHFPIRYPESGVVLDCIDSLSLPSSLLCLYNECILMLTIILLWLLLVLMHYVLFNNFISCWGEFLSS